MSTTRPGRVDSAAGLISTKEAANRLRISPNTLRKYVALGLIPAHKVGLRLLKFEPNDVDKLVRRIDNRTASA
ncbi:helix-turn-helix domain-containing protein [Mycolicibacterium houstonense]|uniref:helix-turn-helix domain-containing protein n=1 Tax=Mycolicibacterium houstonense TaxID=146021 RepID=UPI001C661C37|nr:helix-turn-helix domain-containing protein [Mycolicibacterium houstonense]